MQVKSILEGEGATIEEKIENIACIISIASQDRLKEDIAKKSINKEEIVEIEHEQEEEAELEEIEVKKMDCHEHLIPNTLYLGKQIPIAEVAHQTGAWRFGKDPKKSVLDINCKAHELDNLYVVDTSFFPSIGAVNPSLTAIANTMHVDDHLLERLS